MLNMARMDAPMVTMERGFTAVEEVLRVISYLFGGPTQTHTFARPVQRTRRPGFTAASGEAVCRSRTAVR